MGKKRTIDQKIDGYAKVVKLLIGLTGVYMSLFGLIAGTREFLSAIFQPIVPDLFGAGIFAVIVIHLVAITLILAKIVKLNSANKED
jgi:hypothetical protein